MRALCIKNFFFLSFTPCTPSRACVRATPGEEGERGKEVRAANGSSRAGGRRYARGNSRGIRLSLLRLSERRTGRRAWARTLAHVAECGSSAGTGATLNHNATRGDDAAASGRG